MKKHLLHFLISVLVLSFVSIACNSDNESSSNENSLVEETAVATVEDEGANENSILQDAREEIVSTNVPTDELSESREAIVPLDNILSEPKRVSFILQETNFEIPDDIMQEIKYFTGGGGGGTVCGYIDAIGWESSSPPKDTNLENQSPTIAKMNTITISTCGWIENEEIVVTLIYPDGRKTSDRFVYPHAGNKNGRYP